MKVTAWVSYEGEQPEALGGMGGWFGPGQRWADYLKGLKEEEQPYAEALRAEIVRLGLKRGGFWHQEADDGVPLFEDGKVARFSLRAWGDLLAAVWAEQENQDHHYTDFAWFGPGDDDVKRTPRGGTDNEQV